MNLSWGGTALTYEIWYRNVLDTSFTYVGSTTDQNYSISNLDAATYEFKVNNKTVQATSSGIPVAPIAPTNIVAALQGTQIVLTWTFSPYESIAAYNIKLNGTLIQENFKGNEYIYPQQLANDAYVFSVASVNNSYAVSNYVEANTITINAVPSIVDVTAYQKASAVQFYVDYVGFSSFKHIQVYESLDNNVANKYKLFQQTESNFVRDGLPIVETRYYWFELVDIYGNTGALYGVVSGSTETDPDALMATLKAQQDSGQFLPALADVMLTGIVNGENVVGVDGSLVVDGSIVADKIGVTYLSAISANIGTMTAGYIQNSDNTSYLNLNANIASDIFLQISAGNYFQKDGSFQLGGTGGVSFDGTSLVLGSDTSLLAPVINGGEVNANVINGATIYGSNIFGAVIKSSWIDYTTTGSLTDWQYYTVATVPSAYEANFAHDNEAPYDIIVDIDGYVRLPGNTIVYSTYASTGSGLRNASGTWEGSPTFTDETYSYDYYTEEVSSKRVIAAVPKIIVDSSTSIISAYGDWGGSVGFNSYATAKVTVFTTLIECYADGEVDQNAYVKVGGSTVLSVSGDTSTQSYNFSINGISFTAYANSEETGDYANAWVELNYTPSPDSVTGFNTQYKDIFHSYYYKVWGTGLGAKEATCTVPSFKLAQ